MEQLKKFLNDKKPKEILDVGTGVGNFIFLMNQLYSDYDHIFGIDLHDPSIKRATELFQDNDKIVIRKMDALDMDFPDETFDLVCLSNSLHHLVDRKSIFKEVKRVLKKGGYFLVNEMVSDNLNESQMSHLKLHHFGALIDRECGVFHDNTYQRNDILDILSNKTHLTHFSDWNLLIEDNSGEISDQDKQQLFGIIDRMIQRVTDTKKIEEFTEIGNEIKEYIDQNGYSGATSLVTILKK